MYILIQGMTAVLLLFNEVSDLQALSAMDIRSLIKDRLYNTARKMKLFLKSIVDSFTTPLFSISKITNQVVWDYTFTRVKGVALEL